MLGQVRTNNSTLKANLEQYAANSSANAKLKTFLAKNEGEHDLDSKTNSTVNANKKITRFGKTQFDTYRNNPAATSISDIHEIKNVNPFVEDFVAARMKVSMRPPRMVRFGSNQTKFFDDDSVLGYSNKKRCLGLDESDSILVVKEQDPKYLEEDSHSAWEENIVIKNPIVLEGMLRCWDACGIPEAEFDSEDLIMTVQKLSYGILQALANQGAINKLVKQIEIAEITDDFEECWLELLESLQLEDTVESMEKDMFEQRTIITEQESRIIFLENRVLTLESQLEDQVVLKQECDRNIADAQEARKMYEDQSIKYQETSAKANRLQLDLEEKTIKNEVLLKENSGIRTELNNREAQLKDREIQLKRLQKNMISEQREAIQALDISKHQCSQLKVKCEHVEKIWKRNYSLMAQECEEQNQQFQNMRKDLQKTKEDMERYKLRAADSIVALHAAGEQIRSLELQNKGSKDRVSLISTQLDTLLEFKQKAKAKIISLRGSKQEIKKLNKQMQHIDLLLRTQINDAIDRYEIKETENQQLLKELEESKRLVQETRKAFQPPISPLGHKSLRKQRPLRVMTNHINAY
ncbi:LANO_0C04676g1_1 [Lachancea nothofagi CBS 11611]|uniref:LANO_0C04676g1_1 n=1 Tax=Lachancea nothofagi CBS 11611 TaxID=1266666 RepID=A0A1G4J6W7_9SACH|nr:LANO_0C04676g1_1 [Lachancea nothofagi CBS 11611]